MHSRRLRALLLALVAAHLVLLVVRIPHAAFGKRLRSIREWRERGQVHYHLGRWPESAAAIDWLLEHTPPNCVVPWRGDWKGALEFAPALLWPRILYVAKSLGSSQLSVHGRPIATRGGRCVVLNGHGMNLSLGPR